jgi:hypothetical protein
VARWCPSAATPIARLYGAGTALRFWKRADWGWKMKWPTGFLKNPNKNDLFSRDLRQ